MILVPCAGGRLHDDAAADRADPVAHVHEAVAALRARREVEAGAVVGDLEEQRAFFLVDGDPRLGALAGVLRRVLERFEAAEVDGRLDRGGVATDVVGDDARWAARRGPAAALSASGSPRSISSGG